MSTHGKSEDEQIRTTKNTARFFVENRQIAWVALIGVILWGLLAYAAMPKRKDPEVPVRVAAVVASWPGAPAQKMEELVTRRIEDKIAENPNIEKIDSNTRGGIAVITFFIEDRIKDRAKEFDDINLRLNTIRDLPEGAQFVFQKDFGQTTALMLTVASPKPSEVELQLRAEQIQRGIERVRKEAPEPMRAGRMSLVYPFPATLEPAQLRRVVVEMATYATKFEVVADVRVVEGHGFIGLDFQFKGKVNDGTEAVVRRLALDFLQQHLHTSELHPDVWRAILVLEPEGTEAKLTAVAESRYSYRDLDRFTDTLKKRIEQVDAVSKVTRSGVVDEAIHLEYSQARLAGYGLQQGALSSILAGRNITAPGGVIETQDKTLAVDPSGEFKSEKEIGDVLITPPGASSPAHLRDLVEITRDYQSPPRLLNKFTWRDKQGVWQRTRAVTLAVDMRSGRQIGAFGEAVDRAIEESRAFIPEDLTIARTSDQPKQVEDQVDLFMSSLFEAILLVILVALVGFWEWRSAALLALSIPLTLLMTFGMMKVLGIDVQQISIASLIIALGLLVDDPVVANDAIKQDLAAGRPPVVAAWWGPTKLATAILFATITNIAAYAPLVALPGDMGSFLFSLAVVLCASLVASRIVSMTFVPLLGYYLLRPPKKLTPSIAERRTRGAARKYAAFIGLAIDHRWKTLFVSILLLVAGGFAASGLKSAFFPKDLAYLSYIDVLLPGDAPISATNETLRQVDDVVRKTLDDYGQKHPAKDGKPLAVLKSLTTFAGGGAPRFWFSVTSEQAQPNYAQIVLEVTDKHLTNEIAEPLQRALDAAIPGATIDVRRLDTGAANAMPVALRIEGEDIATLRAIASDVQAVLRSEPDVDRIRNDWGADVFSVRMEVDSDRANLIGITNLDVAQSSAAALSGSVVGKLREGDHVVPIVTRLRASERARLSDVDGLYVRSSATGQLVPLQQISSISYEMTTNRILRHNRVRAIAVGGFPREGVLPSQIIAAVKPKLDALKLPPGYRLVVAGEQEEQKKNFMGLVVVLGISVAAIFAALVFQFRSAVKPLIVFAGIPYGVMGALVSLRIMDSPFGFMAFLGVISLIGVIVSHIIVLFDFIEEMHAHGEPFRDALIDAGIARMRPVLITVGATVTALIPLAIEGGPLWQPLCYAQIGGLTVATVITLVMVPVLYAITVLDLRLVRWETVTPAAGSDGHAAPPSASPPGAPHSSTNEPRAEA
jgi:multidrug efflux pump subunit AcrB